MTSSCRGLLVAGLITGTLEGWAGTLSDKTGTIHTLECTVFSLEGKEEVGGGLFTCECA